MSAVGLDREHAYQYEGERLDWGLDWRDWLSEVAGDEIDTSTWDAGDLMVEDAAVQSGVTYAFFSGNVGNQAYPVINTVTTTGGRTASRRFYIVSRDYVVG